MKSLTNYLASNISDPMRKNHVLAVVKPGFENLLGTVSNLFKENGYTIVKTKSTRLTMEQAEQLYEVHKKESF